MPSVSGERAVRVFQKAGWVQDRQRGSLGLAHALKKPVVLVSSNEGGVPFDLKHIRVIYYDVNGNSLFLLNSES